MKKHALLILAHEDPSHLRRLIRAVTAPWVTVFVHIDAKSNVDEFRDVLAMPGVFSVEPRVKVCWGGWSQVQATLNAIRTAMNTTHFDYYSLLSGTHFPLQSAEFVRGYIESADSELINIVRVPNGELNKTLGIALRKSALMACIVPSQSLVFARGELRCSSMQSREDSRRYSRNGLRTQAVNGGRSLRRL